jgi:hypothetical protein
MLSAATLIYLAIPFFIFFLGWLRWPLAILLTVLLSAALWAALRQLLPNRSALKFRELLPGTPVNCVSALTGLVFLLYLSGVSGFGFQAPDWQKHFAIVNDLAWNPWPVLYPASHSWPVARYLTYYFAYYLPAAAVASWAGSLAGDIVLFLWTLVGAWFSCLWVSRLCGSYSWLVWAVWFGLGGLDLVGVLLRSALISFAPGRVDGWWAGFGNFPSNSDLLIWVPQHMVGGWLTTGLILWHGERWSDPERKPNQPYPPVLPLCLLAIALSSLWTPFVTIGLAPLLVLVARNVGLRALFRQVVQNRLIITGAVATGLLSAIFLSSVSRDAVPSGWSFLHGSWKLWLIKATVVGLLNFGIQTALVLSLLRLRRSKDFSRMWVWLAGIILSLIPLYYAGAYNDFMMRVSIPSLFIVHVMMLRTLRIEFTQFRPLNWQASCLAACIILGFGQAADDLSRHISGTRLGSRNFAGGSRNWTIPELPFSGGPLPATADLIRSQYYGSTQSFFFTKLARRPQTLP